MQAFEEHTLHFIGLLSDGGVHSRYDQLLACLKGSTRHCKMVKCSNGNTKYTSCQCCGVDLL